MAATMASRVLSRSLNHSSPRIVNLRSQQPLRSVASRIQQRKFSAHPCTQVKKYTEDHEWVELDTGSTATIGISTYAAKALGDVVYVELPTTDLEVSKGDTIGAVESVKSASDIMTPVSGKVVDVNSALEDKPATINQSPEGDGWLAKIEVANQSELNDLMDAEAYQKFTEEADSK